MNYHRSNQGKSNQGVSNEHLHNQHGSVPTGNDGAIDAELEPKSPHPYSAVSLSPDYQYAMLAAQNFIQIVEIRNVPPGEKRNHVKILPLHFQRVAQYFHSGINNSGKQPNQTKQAYNRSNLSDAFVRQHRGVSSLSQSQHGHSGRTDVMITDVAWGPFRIGKDQHRGNSTSITAGMSLAGSEGLGMAAAVNNDYNSDFKKDDSTGSGERLKVLHHHSLIAVCASNGVVLIWQAKDLLHKLKTSSGQSNTIGPPEAVLADHSRAVNRLAWHPNKFGLLLTASQDSTIKLWDRGDCFQNEQSSNNSKRSNTDLLNFRSLLRLSSPTNTDNNSNNLSTDQAAWKCTMTITPKSDAIRDVKWSPMIENMFALVTDSGYLILYNIKLPGRPLIKVTCHSGEATSVDWHPRKKYVLATGSGRENVVKVWDVEDSLDLKQQAEENTKFHSHGSDGALENASRKSSNYNTIGAYTQGSPYHTHQSQPYMKRSMSAFALNSRSSPEKNIHTLHVAAPVTRIKWRPPNSVTSSNTSAPTCSKDLKKEIGAHDAMLFVSTAPSNAAGGSATIELWSYHRPFLALSRVEGHINGPVVDFDCLPKVHNDIIRNFGSSSYEAVWQHILSVGRDGRCLLQNLARGQRPIDSVPESTFALGTLAPSETLRGSLQIVSVNQAIPSGTENDFFLTRLSDDFSFIKNNEKWRPTVGDHKEPEKAPVLTSSIVDGYLVSSVGISDSMNAIIVAPELQYVSFFARSYKLKKCSALPTRSAICTHNAEIVSGIEGYGPLARMWMMLSLFSGETTTNGRYRKGQCNPLSHALWSTIVSLLYERAEAGDVQTCVALCEVFEIIQLSSKDNSVNVCAPGLHLETIREWYLSYIDILHQMSLFSLATDLIRSCRDPVVTKLNQQSTTIHESCPACGKSIQSNQSRKSKSSSNDSHRLIISPVLQCLSCRKRVGYCFICNLPVRKGLFVFCPGCGHGGHLKCAVSWFHNEHGLAEEVCPTGCGHKCNLKRQLNHAFPSDATFLCAEVPN